MQGYSSNYPFYGQSAVYNQQSYQNYQSYNSFPYSQNQNATPFIPPLTSFDPPQHTAKPKRHNRQSVNATPLKSAMKRPGATPGPPPPASLPHEGHQKRARTTSNAKEPDHSLEIARSRSQPQDPMEDYKSIHVFLMLVGTSEVHLEYLSTQAQKEIRDLVFKAYPGGIELEQKKGSLWRIRFRGSPWDPNGLHSEEGLQMIVRLFSLFAERGFSVQTTTNIASLSPRLIFVAARLDSSSQFFLAYFSRKGRRVTLITPPPVAHSLGEYLQDVYKVQITTNETISGNRIIEVTSSSVVGVVEPVHFMLLVLRGISDLGFQLETTLLMAPKLSLGPVGIGARRELLVFKGVPARL